MEDAAREKDVKALLCLACCLCADTDKWWEIEGWNGWNTAAANWLIYPYSAVVNSDNFYD